jgi:hypothetical protein
VKYKVKKQKPDEDWSSQACCVMASGPSLGWDDYADVRTIEQTGLKTIAVNSTWSVARFCSIIYAGDNNWWRYNAKAIDIKAERWSSSKSSTIPFGTKYRNHKTRPGYNSGANAIELAANVMHSPIIILLGFDGSVTKGTHHHGDHKRTSNPTPDRCKKWQAQYADVLRLCPDTKIINCSRYTEIKCFERMTLAEALKHV